MLHVHKNTVAKNTTRYTAEETELDIMAGVIKQWQIFRPKQGADLVHIQVFYRDQQVIPWNRGETYDVPAFREPWEEDFPVMKPPHKLVFKAWNLDDRHDHEFIALINIIPAERLPFWRRWFQ